ncbi:MAG TPA: methyltransferase [Chloroflexota bacterium]
MDTDAEVTPEPILTVATGFMAAKHLFVASEVGLFSALGDGPLTLDELAQRTGVPRLSVRILADAMVVLGFVAREDGRYRNVSVAQAFLSGQTTTDLRPALRFFDRISYPTWMHLEDAIRTRRGVRGDLSPEQWEIRSRGVEAISAGAAQGLLDAYDFSHCRRILDLGGGTGSFMRVLTQRYPQVEATLFEQPAVAAVARQLLAGTPEGTRIAVVEGDFFHDPIPPGHDIVLLANVIHVFSPDHNRELLSRVKASSPLDATLLLVDFWTDASHTQPVFAALMAGEWLTASGEADCYSVEEITEWLRHTGWIVDRHQPVAGPSSLVVAHAGLE